MTNKVEQKVLTDKLLAFIEHSIKDKNSDLLRIEGEIASLYAVKAYVNNLTF
jgi:hypothetical protein